MKFLLCLLLISLGSLSSCLGSVSDIPCLRTLYQSLIDPNNTLKSSWNFTDDICRFVGVGCWHPNEDRVMSLRLSNLGLQGQFPKGLQSCSSLTWLDLSSNDFSGPVPSDIARQLPYLTYLDLSNNSFSGGIPVDVSAMTYLNVLNLQHNQLSGQIPRRLGGLARLSWFNVSDNLLSGPIPSSFQKFPASNFAGNQGLCGLPLDDCHDKRNWGIATVWLNRMTIESGIGAIVGFVAGFVMAVYCTASPYRLRSCRFGV